jgi:hypothetical protein
MTDGERSTTEMLAAALVGAFPGFVEGKLSALGVAAESDILYAAESGCIALGHALHELMSTSLALQERSPLELVRVATHPLSEALAAAGVPPPHRDEYAAVLHPEDVYDLYPASSRELGEEVWELHVQWGLDKARVVAGMVPAVDPDPDDVAGADPAVALFGVPRDRSDGIPALLGERGYATLVWRNPAALDAGLKRRPVLVIVALSHPTAHEAIRTAAGAGRRVVAVGDGVDDFATAAVMALGAETALDLDRLLDRLPGLLPRLV